jgi:hypothetical protein
MLNMPELYKIFLSIEVFNPGGNRVFTAMLLSLGGGK